MASKSKGQAELHIGSHAVLACLAAQRMSKLRKNASLAQRNSWISSSPCMRKKVSASDIDGFHLGASNLKWVKGAQFLEDLDANEIQSSESFSFTQNRVYPLP